MNQLVLPSNTPVQDDPDLAWANVGIALSFILVDGNSSPLSSSLKKVVFSIALGLGIEKSILIASARCLIQLTMMVSSTRSSRLTTGVCVGQCFYYTKPILYLWIGVSPCFPRRF